MSYSRSYNDTIQEIRGIDILKVVSDYLPNLKLIKKGSRGNFFGLCPFPSHQEKTPSFAVNPSKGICHCFGCGKGGNAITFVMEINGMDFPEAIEDICTQYNIPFRHDPIREKEREQKAQIYKINESLTEFFKMNLQSENNLSRAAEEYLKSRSLTDYSIHSWGLGLSLDWNLPNTLIRRLRDNFPEEAILNSGTIRERKDGSWYNMFYHRIMFPIMDKKGNIVGFAGRTIPGHDTDKDGKEYPKYMNNAESLVYKKGEILYGLTKSTEESIRETGEAIITEGYLDVILGHQFKIPCIGTGTTTDLTQEQIKILSNIAKKIILCPDYDKNFMGQEAAIRGGIKVISQGIPLTVINLGEGSDDLAAFLQREQNTERFLELKNQDKTLIEYVWDIYGKDIIEAKFDDLGVVLSERIFPIIKAVRSFTSQTWGKRYIAKVLNVTVEDVDKDFGLYLKRTQPKKQLYEKPIHDYVLALCAEHAIHRNIARNTFNEDDFPEKWQKLMFQFLCYKDREEEIIPKSETKLPKQKKQLILFAEEEKRFFEEFKDYCKLTKANISDEEIGIARGRMIQATTDNPEVIKQLEISSLEETIIELTQKMEELRRKDSQEGLSFLMDRIQQIYPIYEQAKSN